MNNENAWLQRDPQVEGNYILSPLDEDIPPKKVDDCLLQDNEVYIHEDFLRLLFPQLDVNASEKAFKVKVTIERAPDEFTILEKEKED